MFILKKYELIYLIRSLKKFNIRVNINLDSITIKLKINIRVLEL